MEPDNCKHISSLIDAYADGEVNQQQKDAVSNHLKDCADCARQLAEVEKMVVTLKNLPQKQVSAKLAGELDTLVDKLAAGDLKAVEAAKSLDGASRSNNKVRWLIPLAAAAAAVAIVVGINAYKPGNQAPVTAQGDVPHANLHAPVVVPDNRHDNVQPEIARNDVAPRVVPAPPGVDIAQYIPKPAVKVHKTPKADQLEHSIASSQVKQPIASSARHPAQTDQVAELPAGTSSFSEAVGLSTDEDGLYDIKM